MTLMRPPNGDQSIPASHSFVSSHLILGLPIAKGEIPDVTPYGVLLYVDRYLNDEMLSLPVSPKLPRSFRLPKVFLKLPMNDSSESNQPAEIAGKYPQRLSGPKRESPSARMLPESR